MTDLTDAKTTGRWDCLNCPWSNTAHPDYGWADHDSWAVWVHENVLCPDRRA